MSDPFAALRGRFLQRTREDLEVLRQPAPAAATLKAVVHRLAGTAGTFGYAEVSRLALVVDDDLQEGREPSPEALAALVAAVEALPQALP